MAQAAATTQRERREREPVSANEAPRDLVQHFTEYAQENPSNAAMWCFFAGFVLGWKLKPW